MPSRRLAQGYGLRLGLSSVEPFVRTSVEHTPSSNAGIPREQLLKFVPPGKGDQVKGTGGE